MAFTDILKKYENFDFDAFCADVNASKVERVINKPRLSEIDFLTLLSPAAAGGLEAMARRARDITRSRFGGGERFLRRFTFQIYAITAASIALSRIKIELSGGI